MFMEGMDMAPLKSDLIEVKTRVIKRNGQEVAFDGHKIINAIAAANREVSELHQMNFQLSPRG